MSIAIVYSRATVGIQAPLVTVEAHLSNGLPSLSIVGLPEAAVKESKDRVRSAIINSGFNFPARRITINLAPADLPKIGGRFDLPIALSILAASGQIPTDALDDHEFIGELALTGALRQVTGVLPASLGCANKNRKLVVPAANGEEAALPNNAQALATNSLLDITAHLSGRSIISPLVSTAHAAQITQTADLSEVKGQYGAKRALEIAAAGGHNLLMIGPPGTGKTMLATRLAGILPTMTEGEALEAAAIRSISQKGFDVTQWRMRPFRAPHHTASGVALVGGGSHPRPGEISLAHQGVLFLDELPEYDRKVLEVLREPLESGEIVISRASNQACFPARFQLIAAMNPCMCGYLGDSHRNCECSQEQINRYRRRLSGPLLDRIDMHIQVSRQPREFLDGKQDTDNGSALVKQRVEKARSIQTARQQTTNTQLSTTQIDRFCALDDTSKHLIEGATEKLGLSARAYHRILKLARTIADLAESPQIEQPHVLEALSYRVLDRNVGL